MSKPVDIRFCYLISAEAGIAHNTDTGEKAEAYVQVKINGAKKSLDDYQASHKEMGLGLAKQYGWEPLWVTPISTEKYDQECGVEEVEHG